MVILRSRITIHKYGARMIGDAGEQARRTDMTRDSKETMRHGERRKFTQTTRSLPARAAGAKLRLVFALISVITLLATMFVTGPFQARVAEAADDNNAGICDGIQQPTIGSSGGINDDPGIATWVGRDMYVGKPLNSSKSFGKDDDINDKLEGSYAMEAEGLTAVDGKLAIRGIKGWDAKDSWAGNGFRFGSVGFGAMFRPKEGADVLVVGGNKSEIKLTDNNNKETNVTGWDLTGRGFVRGYSGNGQYDPAHNVRIKKIGDNPQAIWTDRDEIYAFDDSYYKPSIESYINWDSSSNVMENVQLNEKYIGPDQPNSADISNTTSKIKNESDSLMRLNNIPGHVTDAVEEFAPSSENQAVVVRSHYSDSQHYFEMIFRENSEKKISFNGDGKNSTQIFNLPSSMLTNKLGNADVNGISFEFNNIPEDAVVIVNVTGDQENITFNHGWRFWWNGEEISQFYTNDSSDEQKQKYSKAASAVMWNFPHAETVTILGGRISGNQNAKLYTSVSKGKSGDIADGTVTDDPAANWLGSILVPNGSLETHVSTNGRVWVGLDYMMHNPIGLSEYKHNNYDYYWDGKTGYDVTSASIIGMDQERHSFPWRGENSTQCSTISWKKVADDGNGTALSGTMWGVYGSLENAVNQQNALYTVTDNETNDMSPIGGELTVRNLNPDADYYIRESSTVNGYTLNSNIYVIHTGVGSDITEKEPDVFSAITAVYDKDGNEITDSVKKLLYDFTTDASIKQGIVNSSLPSVEWEKVDSETGALLGGSEWKLYKKQVENDTTTYPVIKGSIADAYGTMVYLDTKAAGWPAEGVTEIPKVSYRIDKLGGWKCVEMHLYGDGIYGAYLPSRGNKIWFSFFLGTDDKKTSQYRPGGGSSQDHFICNEGVAHITVRTKERIEQTQPKAPGFEPAYVDLDSRSGRFKIGGLTEGEYTLQETKVPEGYWLPEASPNQQQDQRYYTFTVSLNDGKYEISWNSSTIKIDNDEITTTAASTVPDSSVGRISNTPTEVSWWKIDADDKDSNDNVKNTVLAGSEWQLQKWDDTANPKAYVDLGSTITDSATTTVYFASTVSNLANLKYGFNVNSSEDKDWMTATVSDAPQSCNGLKMATIPSEGKQFWLKIGGTTLEIVADKGVVLVSTNEANTSVVASQIPACAVSGVQDLNPEPGKFTLKRLPVGKYRLKETKAPLGYVLPADEYIYFEVTAKASETNGVQWKQGWAGVDGSGNPTNLTQGNGVKTPIAVNKVSDSESARAVGNTRKPGEVTWKKIAQTPKSQPKQGQVDDLDTPAALLEEENHQLLAGSEWKLEYTKYGAVQSDAKPTKTLTIKDCVKETKDGTESKTFCTVAENGLSENDATTYKWAVDVEETAGKFKISGMPWGDYVLTEAKAPDGYNLDATPHKFTIKPQTITVKEDGKDVAKQVVGTILNNESPAKVTSYVSDSDSALTIPVDLGKIENEPGVVLPMTGAEGRHLWAAIVGALFVLAAFGCAVALRMRE